MTDMIFSWCICWDGAKVVVFEGIGVYFCAIGALRLSQDAMPSFTGRYAFFHRALPCVVDVAPSGLFAVISVFVDHNISGLCAWSKYF